MGREAQVSAVRPVVLAGARPPPGVVLLHGPGGVGKSALLRRLADDAERSGRPVVLVEADAGRSSATDVVARVEAVRGAGAPLVLIDGVEADGAPGAWLRADVLPHTPQDATVVVAGRSRPAPQWSSDPGWSSLVRRIELTGLTRPESDALLRDRGVPAPLRGAVRGFAGGHPMALSLCAEAIRRAPPAPGAEQGWQPPPDVVRALLDSVVGEVPSADHRAALEICAHAGLTTVDLLRAELGDPAAEEAFAWLGRLPYVESDAHGLRPHGLARRLLDAHLRWRDPEAHAALHGRLWRHLSRRASTSPSQGAGPAASALVSLHGHRGTPHLAGDPETAEEGGPGLVEHRYQPQMRQAVLRTAEHALGREGAALVEFWLDRQPGAFYGHARPGSHEPESFLAWLRSGGRSAAEVDRDPVVAAVWDHVEAGGLVREGEEVAIARFVLPLPGHGSSASAAPLVVDRLSADVLQHAGSMAAAYLVLPDPRSYRDALDGVDVQLVAEVPDAGRRWGVFAHDFREVPLAAFLDRSMPIRHGGPAAGEPAQRGRALARDAFETALRAALRDWHRGDALATNPLTLGRAAVERAPASPVDGLRSLVAEAVARLREDPRAGPAHRAVVATYLERPSTQEAAAARLGLPFSTYRRHLAHALARLGEQLWAAEQHGARPVPTSQVGTGRPGTGAPGPDG